MLKGTSNTSLAEGGLRSGQDSHSKRPSVLKRPRAERSMVQDWRLK